MMCTLTTVVSVFCFVTVVVVVALGLIEKQLHAEEMDLEFL